MSGHERLPTQRLYLDGQLTDATSGESFAAVDPATGGTLCAVQRAARADVERAVASAREAQGRWAAWTAAERGRVLRRAADLLREEAAELARLEVLDTGKPIVEAEAYDLPSAIEVIDYFGGVAATLRGEHVDLGAAQGGAYFYTRREPLGVCAGIGAWNYPLQIAAWKSAPALACGNAMVFKPSELTPVTALRLADVYTRAGVPAGVFNVVQGAEEVGRALTEHAGVAKVSLTGEVATGSAVLGDAAGTLKRVSLELGGKSPLLVFADADLDAAVAGAVNANFTTQGEVCTNGTRVYVEESVHDAFLEGVRARLENVRLGDPLDRATNMGPLISAEHREKVQGYLDRGVAEGARARTAGALPSEGPLAGGYFFAPVVLSGCRDDMTVVREEIFGPVMSVLSFREEDDAVARANDTPYGLAAGVFTRDLARAHRVAARLEAGMCWINDYNVTPPEMPFGGVKRSGLGRENGLAALDHYTQLKSVYVNLGEASSPF